MGKTHWKKLNNPDYLGSYSLEPKEEKILTIKMVKKDMVYNPSSKGKEECIVAYWEEKEKPMILNSTNNKTIAKLLGTPYIEEWVGKKVQIYSTKIKAFGEMVECLRIRDFEPRTKDIKCESCGKKIEGFGKMSPAQMASYTKQSYGKELCAECAKKTKEEKGEKKDDNEGK